MPAGCPSASRAQSSTSGTRWLAWVSAATWAPWQRSAINTAAKLLLLEHGFERLNCLRIEFKADSRNLKSRNAILRIGATEEGTLRRHVICSDGHQRDTVYFSILADEWPTIKARLEARLG